MRTSRLASFLVLLASCGPETEEIVDQRETTSTTAPLSTFSGYTTRTITTPNQGSRGGSVPTYIVLHHMASTGFEGVLSSWRTGAKQGSANYAISNEGEIVGVVPEAYRSWSLSDAPWDSRSFTFEIENEASGGSWPVSAAAQEATAKVVADLSRRYGIPLDRSRVLGHREVYTRHGGSYATACPGGLNMDWIVARARQLLGQGPAPAPSSGPAPSSAAGWALNLPAASVQARVQAALKTRGLYGGPVDGAMGTNGFKAIQTELQAVGYTGPIDGVIEGEGCRLIQTYAARFGGYTGPVDRVLGPNSWAGFAGALERGAIAAPPTPAPAPGASWSLNLPDASTQARVRAGLEAKGRYFGPVDGALGLNGFKGIQTTLRNVGYTGPIDGLIEGEGCRLIQVYATRFGGYTGPIDGVLGPNSWAGFALGLERP